MYQNLGFFSSIAVIADNSADAKKTLAPLPNLFGKFLVDVDNTVALSSTLA
jgi:hypothetical protein